MIASRTYSAPSRDSVEVDVRLHTPDRGVLQGALVESMERIRGGREARIDYRHHRIAGRPGAGQHRGQDTDPGGIRSGWRRLHRRHRRVACGQDLLGTGLCGQGSIHAGDIPTQFPVGTCATAGPGEPGVAGARLGRRGRPRGLASDDRHRLDGLRDLWTGKGGSAPAQLHRPAGLSSAAGRCRRNRRRADGTTAQGPSQHRPGRSQLPAGDGGASAPRRCHGSAGKCGHAGSPPRSRSRCGPTAASMPTPSLPSVARWMSASPSPSDSTPDCAISSRPYQRRTGHPYPIGWTAQPPLPRPFTLPSTVNPTPHQCASSSAG